MQFKFSEIMCILLSLNVLLFMDIIKQQVMSFIILYDLILTPPWMLAFKKWHSLLQFLSSSWKVSIFQYEVHQSVLWCVFSHFFAKEGVNKAPKIQLSEILHELKSLNVTLIHTCGGGPFVHMAQVTFAFISHGGCLNLCT